MKIGKVMKKLPNRFVVRAQNRGKYAAFLKSIESLSEGEYLPVELDEDQTPQPIRNKLYFLNKKEGSDRLYRSMVDPDNEFVMVIWWESKSARSD